MPAKCESFLFKIRKSRNPTIRPHQLKIGLFALAPCLIFWPTLGHASYEIPDNIVNIELSSGLLDTVQSALPEREAVNEAFLNPGYSPNITLSLDSQLAVTFLDEGAGYRNSLGYFSYTGDVFSGLSFGDIDADNSGNISLFELGGISGMEVGMIFGNASKAGGGGSLLAGDTTVLGGGSLTQSDGGLFMEGGKTFEAGSTVGFFVAANAWNGTEVMGWDGADGDPKVYYSEDFLNPENDWSATQGTTSDTTRHVAMQFASTDRGELLVGFEDLDRRYGSDDDFNDVVFLVQSEPIGAISDVNVPVYAAPAPVAGAGLAGLVFTLALFGLGRGRPALLKG